MVETTPKKSEIEKMIDRALFSGEKVGFGAES